MKLVVGLGNPGAQYALNRHNVGFLTVDALVDLYAFNSGKRQGQGWVSEGKIDKTRVLLLKPLTFMNLSGPCVAAVSHFYKIPVDDIIVIHDDLDLSLGTVRVKKGGGHGGHNGLRSLDGAFGKEYTRIRIGIGHPGHKEAVQGYVLSNFTKSEQDKLIILIRQITDAFPLLLENNTDVFCKEIMS